ncbi:DUF2125 domain-containing protein [Cognatishimia sp. F0-27]|uniref:DUF2125 domain-containing protein n=1 Tax=Cognatishimia sp. F0-27 TaxID=2816855 RepID=UPI001D0C3253|nr:DUF2125 domain-containing protein [Cognatishimia sp. F0-27]MCC1494220.1 DUF2125 domain-containing protein [Cognatishimia sp. F0-27]
MKQLTLLVVAAALAWSGFWLWSQQARHAAVADWVEERRLDGWDIEIGAASVRGFPNRLDTTLDTLRISDPQSGMTWEAPFVQILELVYNPGHVILVFPPRQVLSQGRDGVEIESEGLRASAVFEGAALDRFNLEATLVNLSGDSLAVALAGLNAGVARVPAEEPRYRLALAVDAIAGDGQRPLAGSDRIDALVAQAEVVFDRAWEGTGLEPPRPQPTRIDLRQATYRVDDLELALASDVTIDAQGRATGSLAVRAANWRTALEGGGLADALPAEVIAAIEDGLGLLAQLSGNPDTLDLTITLREGKTAIGIIPLGDAPRLTIP